MTGCGKNKGFWKSGVRADGTDHKVLRGRLNDRTTGGQRVSGRTRRRGHDHAIAGKLADIFKACRDLQTNNTVDRALGDHSVIETTVGLDRAPIALDRNIQHHALFALELIVRQIFQKVQLTYFQLRHEPKTAQVHAQQRHASHRRGAC